jgi:hypothetical protein
MKAFLQPLMVILLFVLVRSADLAISAALARSIIRAVAYGVVALLALIVVLITLLGV